jgi:hypothetical protein
VIEFVEELIRIGRAIDPNALFSSPRTRRRNICCRRMPTFAVSTFTFKIRRDSEGYLLSAGKISPGEHRTYASGNSAWTRSGTRRSEQPGDARWHIDSVVKMRSCLEPISFTGRTNGSPGGPGNYLTGRFGIVTREREAKKGVLQRFKKSSDETTQLHLIFPLPQDAALVGHRCSYNGGRNSAAFSIPLGQTKLPAY